MVEQKDITAMLDSMGINQMNGDARYMFLDSLENAMLKDIEKQDSTLRVDLEDSRTLQCFEVGVLGPHDAQAPNWTLKFEILDVYPGTKYDDTVIAELYFDGIDVH